MRKTLALILILVIVLVGTAFAEVPLKPDGRVNDYAGLLEPSGRVVLEKDLEAFDKATSAEIVIVTVNTLDGLSVEEKTMEFAERWKVGKKGENNGVLILVSKDPRKIRIETGYGLEGVLTDAECRRIVGDAKSFLKVNDYQNGLQKIVEGIKSRITLSLAPPAPAAMPAPKASSTGAAPKSSSGVWIVLLVGFIIIGAFVYTTLKRKKEEEERELQRQAEYARKKAEEHRALQEAERAKELRAQQVLEQEAAQKQEGSKKKAGKKERAGKSEAMEIAPATWSNSAPRAHSNYSDAHSRSHGNYSDVHNRAHSNYSDTHYRSHSNYSDTHSNYSPHSNYSDSHSNYSGGGGDFGGGGCSSDY